MDSPPPSVIADGIDRSTLPPPTVITNICPIDAIAVNAANANAADAASLALPPTRMMATHAAPAAMQDHNHRGLLRRLERRVAELITARSSKTLLERARQARSALARRPANPPGRS